MDTPKKNERYTVTIGGMTEDGNGVTRIDGFTIFVPGSAVGDTLEILIVKVQKSYGFGKILSILQPSPYRTEPDCPVFGRCGGCDFRHISYDHELEVKSRWVADHLERIGGFSLKPEPIVASPQQVGYRNKAQYPIVMEGEKLMAGFYAKRSHRVIGCTQCQLQPDFFSSVAETVMRFCMDFQIAPYNEETHSGLLRHLYLRWGQSSGQLMVCLVINGARLPHSGQLVALLLQKHPEITTIVLNHNTKRTNVILGPRCTALHGSGSITDNLCGIQIEISPLAFYQVNHDGAQLLYQLAGEYAGLTGNETVMDLYCGTGTIGLTMAEKAKQIIGIEVIPQAIENARKNAEQNNIHNTRFICADAAEAAARLAEEGVHPDVIVLDPPRKGCDLSVLESIIWMAPQRIVMVSCNSATMARDLKELAAHGYCLKKVRPVDMFPRTGHVECVALMSKED